jgi:hypothetical protein
MEGEEYFRLKAEIMLDINEWEKATLAYNNLQKKKGELPNEMIERIQIVHERSNEREA